MNLIDAVRSGRPFRRIGSEEWLTYHHGLQWPDHGSNRAPNATELLADDWEIQEPEVRITRARFVTAVQESLAHITAGPGVDNFKSSYSYGQVDRVMQELAKRLGFPDA